MYLMLFGLLCLCFVSFVRADSLSDGRSLAQEQSEEEKEMKVIFSMMDSQIEQDGQITFTEFKQAWLERDTNEDASISEDELKATFKKLNVRYSAKQKYMFSDLELTNEVLQEWFEIVDFDMDGAITESEYEHAYKDGIEMDEE